MVYSDVMSAKEIKRLRRTKGYSQSQLARIFKVTVRTVSRWENGKRKVPHIALMALAGLKRKKERS